MLRNRWPALLMLACAATGIAITSTGTALADEQDDEGTREKAHLLQLQADIFRLNVEADYAAALKKLCDTGYGDPNLCRRPGAGSGEAAAEPLPAVAEISGFVGQLTATLAYPDGTRLKVVGPRNGFPGSRLRGGEQVVAIMADKVVIARTGGPRIDLGFRQTPPAAGTPSIGAN